MDERIWSVHTVKEYLATKSNEALIHATGWMNLENKLSEARHGRPHNV